NEVDATEETNAALLKIIRSSYGLLGIVHEVTFKVEKRVKVKYQYRWRNLDRWLERREPIPAPTSRAILGRRAHGLLGFLLPYRRRLLIERRTIARFQRPLPILDAFKLWLRTFAWRTGARPFASVLRLLPPGLLVKLLDAVILRALFLYAI